MIEARVECLCNEYTLPELGLKLVKGDVVWLEKGLARSSRELRLAQRNRALSVRWESRCEVSRAPAPPWLKRKVRAFPRGPTPEAVETPPPLPREPVTPAPRPADVDTAEIARLAAEAAKAELRGIVREELRSALQEMPTSTTLDASTIEAALRSALSGLTLPAQPASRPTQEGVPGPSEPVFIPTGIVPSGSDAKAAINVATEASADSSLDDAASALRAARGSSGRKRRKKE